MFGNTTTDHVTPVSDTPVVERRRVVEATAWWSPAQIVGLILGIGLVVLGITAVVRTGFDTSHIYRPQAMVWHLPHSPLLAVCEIGWGALMVIASSVPGGLRALIALLGAAALALGLVVIAESLPNRLNHWLGVTHRSGVFFVVIGGVALLAAIFSPIFGGSRRVVRERAQAVDAR